MLESLLIGLSIGMLGAIHCMGMCGPLVIGFQSQFVQKQHPALSFVLYHVARVSMYAFYGVVIGTVGHWARFTVTQQTLSIVSGAMLILFFFYQSVFFQQNIGMTLSKPLSKVLKSKHHIPKVLMLGLINGLLPCGLVWSAATVALNVDTSYDSILLMVGFGLGTWPTFILIWWIHRMVAPATRSFLGKWQRYIVLLIGILLILRGLNLGIPYLSPKLIQTTTGHRLPVGCH